MSEHLVRAFRNYVARGTYIMSSSGSTQEQPSVEDEINKLALEYITKKEGEDIHRRANVLRGTATHIGIETPVTVLSDIRSGLEELVSMMRDRMRLEEERHEQLCRIMLTIAKSERREMPGRESTYMGGLAGQGEKSNYYCGTVRLSSGNHLIGACVMKLCAVLDRYDQASGDQAADTKSMDVKEWASLSKILLGCDSKHVESTGVIVPPKPSSPDFAIAAGYVSSTVPGRVTTCDVSHIYELCRSCPSVAGCMKAVIDRILLCPGLVTATRHVKLSRLKFPYASDEATLCTREPCAPPSMATVQGVQAMKHDRRTRYVEKVLRDKMKPAYAILQAMDS